MEEASRGLFKGVKLTIEYTCDINSLDVPHILGELRSYGAAKIIKAEPLSAEQLKNQPYGRG